MFKKIILLFLLLPVLSFAQAIYPEEVLVCEGDSSVNIIGTYPTNLAIDFSDPGKFTSFDSLPDDRYLDVVDIGFSFEFFGNTYTQFVPSTNGYITFDLTQANAFSPWSINSPAPSNASTYNSIYGIYTDVDASNTSQELDVSVYGSAPNRVCIITYDNISMFSCQNDCFYSSIILFEGSNEIVNSVGKFDPCPTWQNGVAVQGLVDATGSANSVITNDPINGLARNFPNTFSSQGDAVKYTPNGSTYTYQFVNYTAVGVPTWYDRNGLVIGQGYSFNLILPPFDSLPYQINARNVICDQIWEDSLVIKDGRPTDLITPKFISCVGDLDGEITYFCEGGENEDWTVILRDISGNIVNQYNGDNLPVTFANLPYGVYTIESNSPSTCLKETEVFIGIAYSKPVIHADVRDVICYGENSGEILFNPHGGFNSDWNVKVYNDAGNLVNTLNSNTTPIKIDNLVQGDYTVVVSSPTTCEDTIEYTLEEPAELRFIYENYDHNNCGVLSSFIDFPVTGGVAPYKFYFDGKLSIDLNRTPLSNDLHELRVVDGNGCELIREIEIQDRHEPLVDFIMPNEVNLEDGLVNFYDASVSNDHTTIESWFWEFGDFGTSSEQNPEHVYDEIGLYKVFLFVTDGFGCQSFLEKEINVITPTLTLPTVFTPNGDGNNEIFKPIFSRIAEKDYEMTISDRWGRQIFETNNIHEGWDGRDKNGNLMSGSYVWIINYTDDFDYKKSQNGLVILIE